MKDPKLLIKALRMCSQDECEGDCPASWRNTGEIDCVNKLLSEAAATIEELMERYLDALNKSAKASKEFEIGDEVMDSSGTEVGYVLNPDYHGKIVVSYEKYACPQVQEKDAVFRTGNKNSEIKDLLQKSKS